MIRKFLKSEKGFTTIEMIIAIPIIISLVWTSFQFGCYMYVKGKVQDAKRIGLKEMEIVGGLNSQVVTKIKQEFSDTSIDISTLVINGTPSSQQYGTNLTLNLQLNYPISIFLPYQSATVYNKKIDISDSITSEYIVR